MRSISPPLILASSSPQRLALLKQLGIFPAHIVSPEIDETPRKGEKPLQLVKRLAQEKAEALREKFPKNFILAGDTLGYSRHQFLSKPTSELEARKMLEHLSGSRHRIFSGVCVLSPTGHAYSRVVVSLVQFKRLSQEELNWYLNTKEWEGKSGSYSIQGYGAQFIKRIDGSFSAIVGLPLFETAQLLKGAGYPLLECND